MAASGYRTRVCVGRLWVESTRSRRAAPRLARVNDWSAAVNLAIGRACRDPEQTSAIPISLPLSSRMNTLESIAISEAAHQVAAAELVPTPTRLRTVASDSCDQCSIGWMIRHCADAAGAGRPKAKKRRLRGSLAAQSRRQEGTRSPGKLLRCNKHSRKPCQPGSPIPVVVCHADTSAL